MRYPRQAFLDDVPNKCRRIDPGIAHPDKPGLYLAGIECDRAMYHSSAVARERDKIRQGVLEGLGWTVFRIWSTDWWTHQQKALAEIHSLLQKRFGYGKTIFECAL